MRRALLIMLTTLAFISCERRELTYGYQPTVEVVINADWSNMTTTPTGMSLYFWDEAEGNLEKLVETNSVNSTSVELSAGVYNILVFNLTPDEYGSVSFEGMDSFETAEVIAQTTKSSWASSKSDEMLITEPEQIAAATYLSFEVTEEAIRESVELKSKGTKAEEIAPYATLSLTPKVIVKSTRVRVRITGIYNHHSARATLYGMATGYNFSEQKSHSTMATHVLESWTPTEYSYSEGEIATYFTSFGLPEQGTTTRAEALDMTRSITRARSDWSDWEGRMDIDILLVDQSTIINESIPLCDKLTVGSSTDSKGEDDEQTDLNANIDINIDSGFGTDLDNDADDEPIVLPDVEPVGGSSSGFDATVDPWDNEEVHDVEI